APRLGGTLPAIQVERIGVHGSGVMARGIAALCLEHGFALALASGLPKRARALRADLLEGAPGADVTADPSDLGACSLILEATVEDLETKRAVLERLEERAGAEAGL